jgi:hypothetical protein
MVHRAMQEIPATRANMRAIVQVWTTPAPALGRMG